MKTRALDTLWAITPERLQVLLAIATRGEYFRAELAEHRRATGWCADVGSSAPAPSRKPYQVQGGVAVIGISGVLMRHGGMLADVSGAVSYDSIRSSLQAAMKDPECRAVLLVIDSPGGEANGCGALADDIRAADGLKPVLSYVEGSGCSGGYWLASAARRILCAPTAFLGSIGVRSGLIDDSEADKKEGIRRIEIISSQSPGKRGTPVDDEVIARVQVRADDLAQIFIDSVAAFRCVTAEKVIAAGTGDHMIASKAVPRSSCASPRSARAGCARSASPSSRAAGSRPTPISRPQVGHIGAAAVEAGLLPPDGAAEEAQAVEQRQQAGAEDDEGDRRRLRGLVWRRVLQGQHHGVLLRAARRSWASKAAISRPSTGTGSSPAARRRRCAAATAAQASAGVRTTNTQRPPLSQAACSARCSAVTVPCLCGAWFYSDATGTVKVRGMRGLDGLLDQDAPLTLTASTYLTLYANKWYYVFAYITAGALAWEMIEYPNNGPDRYIVGKYDDASRRYVGCFRTDGSAHIIPFFARGGHYLWDEPQLPASGGGLTSTSWATEDLARVVPPHHQGEVSLLGLVVDGSGSPNYLSVRRKGSAGLGHVATVATSGETFGRLNVGCDDQQLVEYKLTGAGGGTFAALSVLGWRDR